MNILTQPSCVLALTRQPRWPAVRFTESEPNLLTTLDKTAYVILPECFVERKPTWLAL